MGGSVRGLATRGDVRKTLGRDQVVKLIVNLAGDCSLICFSQVSVFFSGETCESVMRDIVFRLDLHLHWCVLSLTCSRERASSPSRSARPKSPARSVSCPPLASDDAAEEPLDTDVAMNDTSPPTSPTRQLEDISTTVVPLCSVLLW